MDERNYRIITESNYQSLVKKVNEIISKEPEFEPIGGPFIFQGFALKFEGQLIGQAIYRK